MSRAPDIDSRFTLHKRQAAKTIDTHPRASGDQNQKVFAGERAGCRNVRQSLPAHADSAQNAATFADFENRMKDSPQKWMLSPGAGNGSRKLDRPTDLSSQQLSEVSMQIQIGDDTDAISRSQRPFSTGALSGHSHFSDIGAIENLSLEQERATTGRKATPPRTGLGVPMNTLNLKKRPAGTDFSLAEALPKDRFSHESMSPRRSKARSSTNIHSLKQAPVDPDYDRGDVSAARPLTAAKPMLFDPSTDNLTTSISRDIPNAFGFTGTSHVHDSRTHVFRSKKEPLPRGDGHLWDRKQARPSTGKHSPSQAPPGDAHKRHRLHVAQPSFPHTRVQPERDPDLVLQPETRPISQDQLVAEVKGIYAGLVMVEAKCIEVDNKQALAAGDPETGQQPKLSNEQWQALIALHRTLLHEHHDFFLASQHPSASPALRRLAAKYTMPARMWRHGIHSFLELLRHRLPDSLDHMLMFIYLAYSMMALLYETVPTFEDTWIECLGDLGRYRMAIEDDDIRDREVWTGVSRFWYSKAADKSPTVGRLYHHLAILARPNALQQLFYYTRSLTCVHPFQSARQSILTLFGGPEPAHHRSLPADIIFIKIHDKLFSHSSLETFNDDVDQLLPNIDLQIGRITAKWKEQGVFIIVTNIAALFEYGLAEAIFRRAFTKARGDSGEPGETVTKDTQQESQLDTVNQISAEVNTASSLLTISHASYLTFSIFKLALQRIGDKNILPHAHVSLVFLLSLSAVQQAMSHVEKDVPWTEIASFLNTLAKSNEIGPHSEGPHFPQPEKGVGRPLPEDFAINGQIWSQGYHPSGWFENAMVDDEERSLELPSMAAPRVERIFWLGIRIASYERYLRYDSGSKAFSVTPYALELQKEIQTGIRSRTLSVERDVDTKMSGTQDPNTSLDDDSFKRHTCQPERVPLDNQLELAEGDLKSKTLETRSAVKLSRLLRPYFTKLVPDTDCILKHLEDLNGLLLQGGRWSVLIAESVLKELTEISTNDTDSGKAAREALQAIRTSINNTATISIITSEGEDVTNSAMPEDRDDTFNSTDFMNINNDIIDVIKHQEISKHQELYLGTEFEEDEAKSAVLVTEDRAMHFKASAYGIYSVSPSVFRSLKTDQE